MFTRFFLTLLACACIFLIGCTQTPPVDTRADADALRSIEAQWFAATKARDVDKIVGIYTPDAVRMNANGPVVVGHQAIHKALESWLADSVVSNTYTYTLDTIDVSASGDLAYDRGTYRFSQTTPKGLVEQVGKWVTIYKKIDGKWKAILDISNSDKPLPAL